MHPNRIPGMHAQFVDDEVRALIAMGCLVPWTYVEGPGEIRDLA